MENKRIFWFAGTLALFAVAFGAFSFGLESLQKAKYPNGQMASITVTGDGEVMATPDIATVTFTVRETGKTVKEAQKLTEAKVQTALKSLDTLQIKEKDIKTNYYVVSPKYETQQIYCITVPCPTGKTTVVGYDASQSVTVKIRDLEKAGDVLSLLGKAAITEFSGPNFEIDNKDKLTKEAKEKAIKKAEEKAQETAKSLGVSLGAIIAFNDNDGGYTPMYSMKASMAMGGESRDSVSLPSGENSITSRVTITYLLK